MGEKDLTLKFKVTDEGTILLDKINQKISGIDKSTQAMGNSLKLIKLDSIINLGERMFRAGEQAYGLGRQMAAMGSDTQRTASILGMTIKEFQGLSFAAKMADVEQEQFTIGIRNLVNSMEETRKGAGVGAMAFQAIGTSVLDAGGKMKSIKKILEDVSERFKTYVDGPEKLALAYGLFGARGGEAFVNWMSQGKEAMEAAAKMAEKLGITNEKAVKRLADSEDAYKRFGETLKAFKLQNLTPLVETFGNLLDNLVSLKALLEGGISWKEFRKEPDWVAKQRKGPRAVFEVEEGMAERLTKAPAMSAAAKAIDASKEALSAWNAEVERANELGEVFLARAELSEISFWKQQKVIENLARIEGERAEQLANDMFPSMENVYKIGEQMTEGAEKLRIKLLEMKQLVMDFGWEDYASGALEASSEATRAVSRMSIEAQKSISPWEKFNQDMWENISASWSYHVSNILKGTEKLSDGLENLFKGIADVFISEVTKMTAKWLIFDVILKQTGSVSGEQKTNWGGIAMQALGLAAGAGGWTTAAGSGAGTSFLASEGAINMLQHGGMITEPIYGVGRSGKRYSLGETEDEIVIPKSKLGRERQPINIINVVDSRQLDQYLASSAGQNAVLNIIGTRAGEVRRIIS